MTTLDRAISAIPAAALLTHSPVSLVDPSRAAAALRLEQFEIPVWIVTIVLQIGVLAWFWGSGRSARLRDALRERMRSEFAVRFLYGALVAGIDRLAAFVPQIAQYRMMRIMDLANELMRQWFAGWLAGTVVAMIVAGLIAAVVLWLADRTRQWYLYTIAGVIGVTLLVSYATPAFVAPTYARFAASAAPGALAEDIRRLRMTTNNPDVPIIEEVIAPRTRVGRAYVIGWGGAQRIVVSDTLLDNATEPEIRFAIASAFGWISSNSGLHAALISGAMIVLGAALAVALADRIGFRRDDDPVSRLALVGALLGCVYAVSLPFYNGYVRNLGVASEQYAIGATRDRSSAIRFALRRADEALIPLCPSPFAYWYFFLYPAPGAHIAALQGRPDPCVNPPR